MKWAWIIGVPSAIVAVIGVAAAIGFERPWADRSDIDNLNSVVIQHETRIAGLDARGLQWQIESLLRQLYGAQRECSRGNQYACQNIPIIKEEIEQMKRDLSAIRGRRR